MSGESGEWAVRWRLHRGAQAARRIAATAPQLETGWDHQTDEPTVWLGRSDTRTCYTFGEMLGGWLKRLDEATLIHRNRAHDVLLLHDGYAERILKFIKHAKKRRRSAIDAFAKGWRLHEQQQGAVPHLLGAVEWYRGYRGHRGLLVADYVPGESLKALLHSGRCSEALLRELGGFMARLHTTGIVLKDAHKENIWVREQALGGERFALLDLDSLAWQYPSRLERQKLLLKLGMPGWENSIMVEAYWQAVGQPPSRAVNWYLETLYKPVKRMRGTARRSLRTRLRPR